MRDALLALDGGAVGQLTDTDKAFETLLDTPLQRYAKEGGDGGVEHRCGFQRFLCSVRTVPKSKVPVLQLPRPPITAVPESGTAQPLPTPAPARGSHAAPLPVLL